MSFALEVKKELSKVKTYTKLYEIAKAEVYGMLIFCKKFTAKEIYFRTESRSSADKFSYSVAEITGAVVEISETLTARKNNSTIYKVRIPSEMDCERIFDFYGHDANAVSLRINMANLEYDACVSAFLRGAFLTCGGISSPESEYRLEFNTVYKNISDDLCRIIKDVSQSTVGKASSPKILNRRGAYVVYLKGSDDISDLLTLMGAKNASMTLMQVKIEKSQTNNKNRQNNSYIANTEKAVLAAVSQIRAIQKLESEGAMQNLSEELQYAAQLRKAHPEASLKELVEYSTVAVSKSGLNHRLKKLEDIADSM